MEEEKTLFGCKDAQYVVDFEEKYEHYLNRVMTKERKGKENDCGGLVGLWWTYSHTYRISVKTHDTRDALYSISRNSPCILIRWEAPPYVYK